MFNHLQRSDLIKPVVSHPSRLRTSEETICTPATLAARFFLLLWPFALAGHPAMRSEKNGAVRPPQDPNRSGSCRKITNAFTADVKRIFLHQNEPNVIDNKPHHKKRTQ